MTKAAGLFVVLMGLAMLGVLRVPFLNRERRIDLRRVRSGLAGAFPVGHGIRLRLDAVHRTDPCRDPKRRCGGSDRQRGGGSSSYSLGMGLPFLAMAWAYAGQGRVMALFKNKSTRLRSSGLAAF